MNGSGIGSDSRIWNSQQSSINTGDTDENLTRQEPHDQVAKESKVDIKGQESHKGVDEDDGEEDGEDDEDEDDDEEVEEKEDEEEEEEEEDEEEEEEEEPKLKYQRLAGTLGETLKKDAVSTMAVSDRFLALGTHWGVVHILDLNGNDVKRFECHSATVNEISIDTTGEFVASASDDGKVVVNSLYTAEQTQQKNRRPMKAVALEPDYSRKTTRQVASGGTAEELLMSGKGWFGTKDVVIHSGEGPIYTIKWRENCIAWANEAGVKIYDVANLQKFAYIDRPPSSPRADLFRCNLCWKSDTTLLIGWADSVKVGLNKERSKMDVASGLPSRYVEIICQFKTDFIVAGLAPFNDEIVLLAYMVDMEDGDAADIASAVASSALQKSNPPEIHIVDYNGDHVANDVLSLFGYEHYRANDYRLEYLPGSSASDNTFYVVSPKDIVVAKPRDLDDHIEWLVSKAKYEEALKAAENAKAGTGVAGGYMGRLAVADVVEIGLKYLTSLMSEGKYEQAASTMPKILRQDAKLWEEWIYLFSNANQLDCIKDIIPTMNPELGSAVYEMVLGRCLVSNKEVFLRLLRKWPLKLFNVKIIIEAVEASLKNADDKLLLEASVDLYKYDRQHDQALVSGLKLGMPDILSLVRPHNLFPTLQAHIPLLMSYDKLWALAQDKASEGVWSTKTGEDAGFGWREDEDENLLGEAVRVIRWQGIAPGVKLLVGNTDRVPVVQVVAQIKENIEFLHVYLDALFRQGSQESSQYHPLQIELYADFDSSRLLDFLRTSTFYNVKSAFEICEFRDLVREMVFLLGKMGDNRRALGLVIERLGDVRGAIDFAKEQNDEELWEDLIKYSMDKPPFIVGLLENLGSYIDPVKLIQRIPNGLKIPGLRDALIKIMTDYSVQVSLKEGCQKILVSDTIQLMESLRATHQRALYHTDDVMCSVCNSPISVDNPLDTKVVFFCKHVYHQACLSAALKKLKLDSKSLSSSDLMSNQIDTSQALLEADFKEQRQARIDSASHRIYEQPPSDLLTVGASMSMLGMMRPPPTNNSPAATFSGIESVVLLSRHAAIGASQNSPHSLHVKCPICQIKA